MTSPGARFPFPVHAICAPCAAEAAMGGSEDAGTGAESPDASEGAEEVAREEGNEPEVRAAAPKRDCAPFRRAC